jgi:hypothetical protein
MDKSEATKRLDAIKHEAKELRAIIERGDVEEYDYEKLYVAEIFGDVYLLFGKTKGDVLCRDGEEEVFCWLSFENHPSQQVWSSSGTTAKEALAIAKRKGILYSFTNHKEGMAFFAKKYAELN